MIKNTIPFVLLATSFKKKNTDGKKIVNYKLKLR